MEKCFVDSVCPPLNIQQAAVEIGCWFADNNIKHWELAHCASRDSLEQLRQRVAKLSALQADNATAWAQAHRLALELECLLLETMEIASISEWWDSGMEALSEYQRIKPGAAEEAEAWAKIRITQGDKP